LSVVRTLELAKFLDFPPVQALHPLADPGTLLARPEGMSDAPKGDAAPADAPAKPKSKLPLIAGAAVLVLAGAGGGGYWWWSHRAPADPQTKAEEKVEPHTPEDAGVVGFEPFVANLADEGGTRFLRASLKLVVAGAETAKEVEENAVEHAILQSAILEILTVHTAEQLVKPEGKAALKKEILEKTGHVLHSAKVTDVLFTEFVVQF
jgi:flagellar FliL protein